MKKKLEGRSHTSAAWLCVCVCMYAHIPLPETRWITICSIQETRSLFWNQSVELRSLQKAKIHDWSRSQWKYKAKVPIKRNQEASLLDLSSVCRIEKGLSLRIHRFHVLTWIWVKLTHLHSLESSKLWNTVPMLRGILQRQNKVPGGTLLQLM